MDQRPEFDHYAENYDKLLAGPLRDGFIRNPDFYHRRKWELIAGFLKDHNIQRGAWSWLDVGCGKGELLREGRSFFRRVAGCDPSQEMVREADGLEVHQQESATSLPFADASFDFATAVCVYHHVEAANRVLLTREIGRILRPNGILCIIEHNPFNPVTQMIVRRCPIDVDAHLLTLRTATNCVEKAGFRRLQSQYFLCIPERFYATLGGVERYIGALPLGGQYALFARK